MCLTWRDFDRAARHFDVARAMNPNSATIQITWGWAQGCLGNPEKGLPGAELAMRLNPHYPRYYEHYLSRILFLLQRHGEVATILERLTAEAPLDQPRDLAFRAAALGHLGRTEEARRCGEDFLEGVRQRWRGDLTAGPKEYVDWLIDCSYLRRPEDEAHLREGLRLAGLPT